MVGRRSMKKDFRRLAMLASVLMDSQTVLREMIGGFLISSRKRIAAPSIASSCSSGRWTESNWRLANDHMTFRDMFFSCGLDTFSVRPRTTSTCRSNESFTNWSKAPRKPKAPRANSSLPAVTSFNTAGRSMV